MSVTRRYLHDIDLVRNKLMNPLLNPLTSTQRLALSLGIADEGYATFDTTLNNVYFWDGSAWITTGGGGSQNLQQVVNIGNGISNFGGSGNASIQSTNFTNNRTLYLNDNAYPTIRLVDNNNASNYLQIDIDTLNIDGTSYNWSTIVNPPTGTLVALPFTTDHLTANNNQYVIGDVVWYLGNVYRCIANNDSLTPSTSPAYWTSLGAGFPLVQQPADWNSTSGNNQILNKPTIPTGTVTGTGTATRVAFWDTASSLSSDSELYWDNTNKRLGIGGTPSSYKLEVNGTGYFDSDVFIGNGSKAIFAYSDIYIKPELIGPAWEDLAFYTNNTEALRIKKNSSIIVSNLAGTGTRMVVADSTGVLSTQTIPTGSSTGFEMNFLLMGA